MKEIKKLIIKPKRIVNVIKQQNLLYLVVIFIINEKIKKT